MTDKRLLLTDRSVEALPLAEKGQYLVRDSELRGFFVLIGARSKAYMVQADFRRGGARKSVRAKVGSAGEITAQRARAAAKTLLGEIQSGVLPKADEAPSPSPSPAQAQVTLREAWERYRDAHMRRKGRSEGTIANYRDHMDRLLKDWLDEPLAALAAEPRRVAARHDAISATNGLYIANGCMRSLRAIYNHARKANPELPADNPVNAVDWNQEARRNSGLGPASLAPWFDELARLDNPFRREFHLLSLLSACRPTALKNARLTDLDFKARILHVPTPKGGAKRAFDIPLSRPMILCAIRCIRLGRILHPEAAQTWLFPAHSESGHLEEHKEDREDLSKWGNDLRQTYRTVGQAAGVSELDLHLLMNHSLPGVSAGYITRHELIGTHLRSQQEKISKLIVASSAKDDRHLPWLRSGRVPPPRDEPQPNAGAKAMAA